MKIKRPIFLGLFLTFWPFLIILTIFFGIADSPYSFGKLIGIKNLPFELTIAFLYFLVNIIAVVMIWKWLKWGVYILAGIIIASSMLTIVSKAQSESLSPIGFMSELIVDSAFLLVILYLVIRPVWKNFK